MEPTIERLNDALPICFDPTAVKKWRINIAFMDRLSPTGMNWGYMPTLPTYETKEEAEKVRKELFEAICRVQQYVLTTN